MKKTLSFILLLLCFVTLSCRAQYSFRRVDGTVGVYPYATMVQSNDVVLLGTPGRSLRTNYNMPLSLLLEFVLTNSSAGNSLAVAQKAPTNSPTIWTPSIINLRLPQPAGSADYFAATDTNSTKLFWLDQDGVLQAANASFGLLAADTANVTGLSAGGGSRRGITLTQPNSPYDFLAGYDSGSGKLFWIDNAGIYHGNGSLLTGDDEAYNATTWNGALTFPTKNAVRDQIEAIVLGSSSQTPYTGTHNAAGNSITNVSLLQLINGGIQLVMKRATLTSPSHKYEAFLIHYGNLTTNAYWNVIVESATNTEATVSGDYDSLMSLGFNSPSSTNYNGNLPSVGFGMEDNYLSSGIRQGEVYMNFRANSNSIAPRPWGWSLKHNGGNGLPYIFHNWNINQFEINASNQLAAISIIQVSTNGVKETILRDSQLSFEGNTRGGGDLLLDVDSSTLLGHDQFNMLKLGNLLPGNTNTIVFGTTLAGSLHKYFVIGSTNSYAGLARYNINSNYMECFVGTGPLTYGSLTNDSKWRPPYPTFASVGEQSFYQNWVLSATTGDTRELGVYTNSTFQGDGLITVEITSANNAGTLRFSIPFNKPDCQSTATWREVLPEVTASDTAANKVAVDFIGMALDSCKLRVRQTGSQAETLRITIKVVGDSANQWINTAVTGSSGTVSGIYRHSAISSMLGKVGIGTKNPTTTLDVAGTLHASGAVTLDSAVTLSGGTANSVYGTDGGKALIAYGAGTGIAISGGSIAVNGQQVTNLDGTTPNLFNGNSLTLGTANIGAANGNGRGLTNINGANVLYGTNAGSTALFPVGKGGIYSAIITNGNITFTGCSGIDANATNVQWGVMYISNTTAAAASVTVPASWGPTTSVNYTGQIRLAFEYYPKMGSNWTYKYR